MSPTLTFYACARVPIELGGIQLNPIHQIKKAPLHIDHREELATKAPRHQGREKKVAKKWSECLLHFSAKAPLMLLRVFSEIVSSVERVPLWLLLASPEAFFSADAER